MKTGIVLAFLTGCAGSAPAVKQTDKAVVGVRASGKNFKLASRICRPYGGVAFVAVGENLKAECRDGLEISKKTLAKTEAK